MRKIEHRIASLLLLLVSLSFLMSCQFGQYYRLQDESYRASERRGYGSWHSKSFDKVTIRVKCIVKDWTIPRVYMEINNPSGDTLSYDLSQFSLWDEHGKVAREYGADSNNKVSGKFDTLQFAEGVTDFMVGCRLSDENSRKWPEEIHVDFGVIQVSGSQKVIRIDTLHFEKID